MKNIFVVMMVAMMMWNRNVEEISGSNSSHSRFTIFNHKRSVEEVGFATGTKVKEIRGWYINGYQFTPKEIKHKGAVVIFGGSEGSPNLPSAIALVNEGYEVYAMYFFGQENQRKELDRVPLEFFAELYLHIQKTARSPKPLTIEGTSKGTELALLLAAYYPVYVDHLILYAPMNYVFQGYAKDKHSSWTFQGKELPFIHTDAKEGMIQQMIALRNKEPRHGIESYQYGLDHDKNKDKARINLAPIRAKMLIFAGELDAAIPAADMGREIKENYKGECELMIFEKAGHSFSEFTVSGVWAMGGDPEANVQAGIESERIRLEKLAEWTK